MAAQSNYFFYNKNELHSYAKVWTALEHVDMMQGQLIEIRNNYIVIDHANVIIKIITVQRFHL